MANTEFDTILGQMLELAERIHPATADKNAQTRKKARTALEEITKRLSYIVTELDQVVRPPSIFDPTNPTTAGRVVALALVAQPRRPLSMVPEVYGSGVYAIYYKGDFPAYAALSGTEHPIYVGKADPDNQAAKDAIAQGVKVTARLKEHAKNIAKAKTTISLDDFECRFLIVQTGFQKSAEDYLIHLFKPIWNSETNISFGLGKHGDSSGTRANKRSPWDTMHPGRKWAVDTTSDQKPREQIVAEIDAHLTANPPYHDLHEIIDKFMADMRQLELDK